VSAGSDGGRVSDDGGSALTSPRASSSINVGAMKVIKGETFSVVSRSGPGESVGEAVLVSGRARRKLHASAETASQVIVASAEEYTRLVFAEQTAQFFASLSFLSRVPAFAESVPDRVLRRLVSSMATHVYPKGSTVLKAGESSEGICLIRAGQACLACEGDQMEADAEEATQQQRRVEVSMLGEGSIFGDRSGLTGEPERFSVVAVTELNVAVLTRAELALVLQKAQREELTDGMETREAWLVERAASLLEKDHSQLLLRARQRETTAAAANECVTGAREALSARVSRGRTATTERNDPGAWARETREVASDPPSSPRPPTLMIPPPSSPRSVALASPLPRSVALASPSPRSVALASPSPRSIALASPSPRSVALASARGSRPSTSHGANTLHMREPSSRPSTAPEGQARHTGVRRASARVSVPASPSAPAFPRRALKLSMVAADEFLPRSPYELTPRELTPRFIAARRSLVREHNALPAALSHREHRKDQPKLPLSEDFVLEAFTDNR